MMKLIFFLINYQKTRFIVCPFFQSSTFALAFTKPLNHFISNPLVGWCDECCDDIDDSKLRIVDDLQDQHVANKFFGNLLDHLNGKFWLYDDLLDHYHLSDDLLSVAEFLIFDLFQYRYHVWW